MKCPKLYVLKNKVSGAVCGIIPGERELESTGSQFMVACINTCGLTDPKSVWSSQTTPLMNTLRNQYLPILQDLFYLIIYKEGLRKVMQEITFVSIQQRDG